jgi:hypothetical protein
MVMRRGCCWFLLFFVHFSLISSSLRVLFIGDSIDRYLLHDWCHATNGHDCQSVDEAGPAMKPFYCTTNASHPTPLYNLFHNSKKAFSWEISVCDNLKQNITLGILFNKQGVSPYPPWFHPQKSHLESEDYAIHRPDKTVRDLFHHFLQPALPGLFTALGGPPQAISINSCFWDIARMLHYGGTPICESTVQRHEWIQSWTANVSTYIDTIQEAIPSAKWTGWRMSHNITYRDPPCRWLMIKEMNEAVQRLIVSKKMHWEPWLAEHPLVNVEMRDATHPGIPANLAHMNALLSQIQRDLHKPSPHKQHDQSSSSSFSSRLSSVFNSFVELTSTQSDRSKS